MRDLILDFKRGGASVPEVVHGIVRIWGTEVRPNGPSVVVTTETTLKLSNGKATLANAQTSGTGPLYEWAYIIQVEPFHGRNYRFYVAIPNGTGPVNLKDLPKLNPYTGEGFYVDIEEWEAIYGALPSRVDALETSQGTQNTQIAALQTGKANTTHTHVIGDVAGLQPALNTKGNATMRVDTTVGTRVFITDGVTERMLSGDTGWRDVSALLAPGWLAADANSHFMMRRVEKEVFIEGRIAASGITANYAGLQQVLGTPPSGFKFRTPFGIVSPAKKLPTSSSATPNAMGIFHSSGFLYVTFPGLAGTWKDGECANFQTSWLTSDSWPTSLPGTPA